MITNDAYYVKIKDATVLSTTATDETANIDKVHKDDWEPNIAIIGVSNSLVDYVVIRGADADEGIAHFDKDVSKHFNSNKERVQVCDDFKSNNREVIKRLTNH